MNLNKLWETSVSCTSSSRFVVMYNHFIHSKLTDVNDL